MADGVPAAVRDAIREAVARVPADGAIDPIAAQELARTLAIATPSMGADLSLAEPGMWLTDARRDPRACAIGCAWLARFPSWDSVRRLADVARSPAAASSPELRAAAISALADRELRDRHPSTLWPADALALADEVLWRLAEAHAATGRLADPSLARALRHVHSEAAAAVIARSPAIWHDAIECAATPALARVIYTYLDDLPVLARLRALHLIADTLGDDALPILHARVLRGGKREQREALQLAVAIGGEPELPALEAAIADAPNSERIRARARWHLAHRGVVPIVRALRTARATATIPIAERAARCAQAADDFAALTPFARYGEPEVHALWAWMVHGAGDPSRAPAVVAASGASERIVGALHLEHLAGAGKVRELIAAAHASGRRDLGALWLARIGRPHAALALAATALAPTPEAAFARALACYRIGRPDLMARILADADGTSGAIDAADLIALARAAPDGAEPDHAPSPFALAELERRLARKISGATVCLVGEFRSRDHNAVRGALAAAGARVIGPLPGVEFYVRGDTCAPRIIADLERQGARALRPGEVAGV